MFVFCIASGYSQEIQLANMSLAEIINKSSDYYFGRNGVSKDLDKTRECLLFVASQKGKDALFAKIMLVELNLLDCETALKYFKEVEKEVALCKTSDNSMFMNFLSRNYQEESEDEHPCTPKNDEKSHYWAETSAGLGDAEGQYLCGCDYLFGFGTEFNQIEGLMWIRKSADGGYKAAMMALAQFYVEGVFVQQNDMQALFWWKEAAKYGSNEAYYYIASAYYYGGDGVESNLEEAKKWCREGIDLFDNTDCCWLLSEILYDEQTVPERLIALEKAAEHDNKSAQAEMAKLHAFGLISEADSQWGIQTLKMLSNDRNPRAMAIYGIMLHDGLLIRSNQVEGSKLIRLSAKNRDRLGIQFEKDL